MKSATSKRKPFRLDLRRGFGFFLILLLGGFFWLLIGIPGAWVAPWIQSSLPEGPQVHFSEFRYQPGGGFRFSDVHFYTARDRVTPIVSAKELGVEPHIWKRLREKTWSVDVDILDGTFETNLGIWADDLRTDQPFLLHDIQGSLYLESEKISFRSLKGSLPNIDVNVRGDLFPGDTEGASDSGSFARKARIVAEVMVFIENFRFASRPQVNINVSSVSETDPSPRIELSVDHTGLSKHRGFEFEEMKAQAVFETGVLDIPSFLIRENSERSLTGRALVDFERDVYEVELNNTLRRFGLEAISPFTLGKLLDSLQLRIENRCDFKIKIGPNSFENPGHKLKGRFLVENGFFRDSYFPELTLDLDLDFPRLRLSNVKGELGQDKGRGPIEGELEIDFASGFTRLDLKGAFYPDYAVSMVGPFAEKYLREWEFKSEVPEFTVKYLRAETGAPLDFGVEAKAENVIWRGTSFDRLSAVVSFKEGRLSIRDARANREREFFSGELLFSPGFKGCTFEVKSNFHFPDVAQLIGPQLSKYVQAFRFEGPSTVAAKGFLDFTRDYQHDAQVAFTFDDLVWQWMSVNHLSGNLRLKEQVLELPDIQASLEGGALGANFRAEKVFEERGQFALAMKLENMDLYKVITKATDLEDTLYRGQLSLDLNLTGALHTVEETPRTDSFTGRGRLEIKDGSLFRIPLLLGLSHILSRIVRGFGYASQSDFKADFEIGEGEIRSEELFLQGNVLSIAGPGSYTFSDRNISADLKIHLLKDGILSDALKLILWPIRKLVEVQLTGTLDHPDWQPKNLPKEIFGK